MTETRRYEHRVEELGDGWTPERWKRQAELINRGSRIAVGTLYCSKSPHGSCGKSFVVIYDATKARAATNGSILALDNCAKRDQRIAQTLMLALELMMRDIHTQHPTQHPLPDRKHSR